MPILSSFPGGGSSGSKLTLPAVTNIKTLTAHGRVYVKWIDPDDIITSGETFAVWGGTLLVRKAGSMPVSRRDGTIVLDSKTRDAYQSTYFCDSGLTDGTTYYYKLFPYTTNGAYTDSPDDEFTATPQAVAPGNVSGISVTSAGNGKLDVKWTDPASTVTSDGVTLATWASTKVVYKAGSYPTSPEDGTLAINSTTRNAYASSAYTISGLTNGTKYYIAFFPVSTEGAVNTDTANRTSGTPNRFTISTVPSQNETLTYNGNTQTPTWSDYDPTQLTIGGATSGVNADTYTVTFKPKDDYCWSDASATAKSVTWSIQRAVIENVPTQNGSLVYTGSAQTVAWSNYDSTEMTIGGDTSGTDAGNYTATFTPKANYQWADGSVSAKTVTWSIQRATISAVPTQSVGLTYNGSEQTVSWDNYDASKMTLEGTTSSTNAGNFTVKFTLAANYQWADGTTTAKNITWTIAKAAGSLSIDPTSITLNASNPSGTITVTRTGDGVITATSSNTNVATVSVNGTTITVNNVNQAGGSATITVGVADGTNHTAPANVTCVVTASFFSIYGVSWDGTTTTKWTRTDDSAGFTDPVPYVAGATSYGSPFDNLQPWAGMVKLERDGGTMVAIPKFWYKFEQNGAGMTIRIADAPVSGYSVSPAHMDRGDGKGERDVVYIGRYHCGASNYKSVTGQNPKNNITRATARTEIHKLGSNIWQADLAMRVTIWLLYIVEFADWNSQKCIGYGCGNNSGVQAMGYTDSMPYCTGTTQSGRTVYGLGTQYRNIEGLWDNVFDWVDGCYYNGNGLNLINNPNSFSDTSGGTAVGVPSDGWPSKFTVKTNGPFPIFIPTEASGSDSTYSCDYWSFNASYPCVFVGGYYGWFTSHGLFCVSFSSVSNANAHFGSRLQELP